MTSWKSETALEDCIMLFIRFWIELSCDEKWIDYNNRKRLAQWLNKDELPNDSPKSKIHHQKKMMMYVLLTDVAGIYYDLIKTSITAKVYCSQLGQMM